MITYYHPPPKPITPAHGYQLPAKDRRRLVRTGRELKPHALPREESSPVTTSNRFVVLGDDSNTTTLTVVEKSHRLYKVYIGSFAAYTTENDVRKYLATQVVQHESDIADVSLLKPKARNNRESVSFCISVGSAAANEAVYDLTRWPSGVNVREYKPSKPLGERPRQSTIPHARHDGR